jgi:hypothetical protein
MHDLDDARTFPVDDPDLIIRVPKSGKHALPLVCTNLQDGWAVDQFRTEFRCHLGAPR